MNQQGFDLMLLLLFGLVGFGIAWFALPVLPLILGVILGPLLETNDVKGDLSTAPCRGVCSTRAGGRRSI